MRQGLLVLATLVVAACDSSTTPAVVVSLSGPSTVQGFDTTIGGAASYGCHYLLTATAAGGGTHDYATWETGHYTLTRQDGATFSGDLQNASNLFGGQLVLGPGQTHEYHAGQLLDSALPVLRGAVLLEAQRGHSCGLSNFQLLVPVEDRSR